MSSIKIPTNQVTHYTGRENLIKVSFCRYFIRTDNKLPIKQVASRRIFLLQMPKFDKLVISALDITALVCSLQYRPLQYLLRHADL